MIYSRDNDLLRKDDEYRFIAPYQHDSDLYHIVISLFFVCNILSLKNYLYCLYWHCPPLVATSTTYLEEEKQRQKYEKLKSSYRHRNWKDADQKPILFDIVDDEKLLDVFLTNLIDEKEEEKKIITMIDQRYQDQTVLTYCLDKMGHKLQKEGEPLSTFVESYFFSIIVFLGDQIKCGYTINLDKHTQGGKSFIKLVHALSDEKMDYRGTPYCPKEMIFYAIAMSYDYIIDRCFHNQWKDPDNNDNSILFTLYKHGLLNHSFGSFKDQDINECFFWEKMIDKKNDQGRTLLEQCAKDQEVNATAITLLAINRLMQKNILKMDFQHKDRQGYDAEYYINQIPVDKFCNENAKKNFITLYRNMKKKNEKMRLSSHNRSNQDKSKSKLALSGHTFMNFTLGLATISFLGFTLWYGVRCKNKNNIQHRKQASSLTKRI